MKPTFPSLFTKALAYSKLWNVLTNTAHYIGDIEAIKASAENFQSICPQLYLILLFLTAQSVHSVHCGSTYHSTLHRLLVYDVTLFLACPPTVNYIILAFCLEEIAILYLLYWLDYNKRTYWQPIVLMKQVFFYRDQSWFYKRTIHFQGKRLLVEEAVRRYTGWWILVLKYFVAFAVLIMISFTGVATYYIWRLQDHFFSSMLQAALHSISLCLCALTFNFMITGLVTINAIPSIVFFAITFIIFIQLKQIKASLRLEYFSWATFQRYRRLHTTALDMALSVSSIYGRMLLAFFSIYLSSNTFIVTSICHYVHI